MSEEVSAIIVIEVLGRPAEHVTQAMEGLIVRLGSEKGVTVTNKKIHEPQAAESAPNLFISFTEVEAQVVSLTRLLELCFTYMPSSVEIVKPAELRFKLNGANAIVNFLLARLHQYDAVAKKLSVENMVMRGKLGELGVKEIDVGKEAAKLTKNQAKTAKKIGKRAKNPKKHKK